MAPLSEPLSAPSPEHFDVLIVGAGLSGIGAAYHLQERCPGKSYAIVEGRGASGGTWDLFRYPGVRSDSDMYTLGYRFRPWRKAKAIADGPSILDYVRKTAEDYSIDKKIRFNHWVTDAAWSSEDARWTVTAMRDGEVVRLSCNFLWMCSGYYRYSEGYTPDFKGVSDFKGRIAHPQHWPQDLDCTGKRVVVIGSGATAVTLIPSLADKTAHITMLQRSPTFMYSMPAVSPFAKFLSRFLPASATYAIMRWQRVILQQFFFKMARARPQKTKDNLIEMTRSKLPSDYDVETHFTPDYYPWDQRLCLVPDDDLFEAISSGRASVVTDEIDTFTPTGIKLKSGKELDADIIITATGLILEALGGAKLSVDGRDVNFGETFSYKGMMYDGVPNMASVFGYTNASWTLRADLISEYVCRLINHMDKNDFAQAMPHNDAPAMEKHPYLDFSSGYVKRAEDILPKQGSKPPWRHPQNYAADLFGLRYGQLEDGVMEFKPRPAGSREAKSGETARIAAE